MKVLIRGPSQAIEVEGIFWYIVAALFFFFQTILMALYCLVMLKTSPWFSADINTESYLTTFKLHMHLCSLSSFHADSCLFSVFMRILHFPCQLLISGGLI